MFKLNNVTLGSDPEFGVVDFNGNPRSVVGLLGGTKHEPIDIGNGCSKQEDNVGAEICIPPTNNKEEFIASIMYGKEECSRQLFDKGLELISASSLRYDAQELCTNKAMEFGCEPSFCVYTRTTSERPDPRDVGNLRSFGFHVHIGFDGISDVHNVEKIIKAMDLYCGLPSIIIDTDMERRQLYGNAGDFRFKQLATKNITIVEYRTLGGNMHASEELIGYVFDQTMKAVEAVNNWETIGSKIEKYEADIRDTIDSGNIDSAKELCRMFDVLLFQREKILINA